MSKETKGQKLERLFDAGFKEVVARENADKETAITQRTYSEQDLLYEIEEIILDKNRKLYCNARDKAERILKLIK